MQSLLLLKKGEAKVSHVLALSTTSFFERNKNPATSHLSLKEKSLAVMRPCQWRYHSITLCKMTETWAESCSHVLDSSLCREVVLVHSGFEAPTFLCTVPKNVSASHLIPCSEGKEYSHLQSTE